MPTVRLGNESVIETYKPFEGINATLVRPRPDLGRRVVTMSLNESTLDANAAHARRFWRNSLTVNVPAEIARQLPPEVRAAFSLDESGGDVTVESGESDQPPAWVECPDSEALELVLAEAFGCRRGRPKAWKEG